MSIEELKTIDSYKFYIRTVTKSGRVHLSSMPFYSKASGLSYELSMLRDVEYSFKYTARKKMSFELYAIKILVGEKFSDMYNVMYNHVLNDSDSNRVLKICSWNMCLGDDKYSNLKNYCRKFLKINDDVSVHWWINSMRENNLWYFSNPEFEIKTSLLVKKLC